MVTGGQTGIREQADSESVRHATSDSVTDLLHRYNRGDRAAMDVLIQAVNAELESLARHYLQSERKDHTLDTRALVNETYMRLVGQRKVSWKNRKHFFGVAAQTMRRILCDYARQRKSIKRGGPERRPPLRISDLQAELARPDTIDPDLPLLVDQALTRLAARDPVAAELVELRYFGGFTLAEISEILGIPLRTLSRKWRFARAWLHKELNSTNS